MVSRNELANALRVLAIDAIEQAKSGHPGAPMGMADMAEALWRHYMKHNPADPHWADRDRFILSNGHASMLLYGLLHLSGYEVSMEDIRQFRQMGSKTPGHPERGLTPGVEVTTGPLGQGIAMGVGMALAEQLLAATFNREGFPVVDHRTWVFMGDGCLMEGLSQEACSLAGTLGLGKLVALYDDNGISIDGPVKGWFSEDVPARFEAMGWHVVAEVNGHSPEELDEAIAEAMRVTDKPSLICCKTVIGFGAPVKAGTAATHGSPLGPDEAEGARKALGWKYPPFTIPEAVMAEWNQRPRGSVAQAEWEALFAAYEQAHPILAAEFRRRMNGELPVQWEDLARQVVERLAEEPKPLATRVAGKKALDVLVPLLPEMVGGSADLTGSVGTRHAGAIVAGYGSLQGDYINYGVREFGMGAIINGMACHGGLLPFGGTFMVFSDYAKNAIRLAALMKSRVVWVLTHDSIGLGEDGSTHQPVEQVAGLRLTPNVDVWRPCDAVETAHAWLAAVERKDGPTCLSLSRQNLPPLERSAEQLAHIRRGGYIVRAPKGEPQAVIMATGSEVILAVEAAEQLAAQGIDVQVVSLPCCEVFDRQDASYRDTVLPPAVRCRVAVEAAAADWWWKYVGLDGRVLGMTTFGESAPAPQLFEHFGFTVPHIINTVKELL